MLRRQFSTAATIVVVLSVSLALPTLFVLLGSTGIPVAAQESGAMQTSMPPVQASASPKKSTSTARQPSNSRSPVQQAKTAKPLTKPSGKMAFVPDSRAPRGAPSTANARPSANSVARRQPANQPSKIAVARPKPTATPRSNNSRMIAPAAPVEVEEPIQIAQELEIPVRQPVKIREPVKTLELEPEDEAVAEIEPVEEMELVTETEPVAEMELDSEPEAVVESQPVRPAQLSERPELPFEEEEFKQPIARRSARSSRMLDEPTNAEPMLDEPMFDDDVAEAAANRNVERPIVAASLPPDRTTGIDSNFSQRSQVAAPRTNEPATLSEIIGSPEIADELEVPPARPRRAVVQLDFEENDLDQNDPNESMELVHRHASPKQRAPSKSVPARDSEIQNVAAQEKPAEPLVPNAANELEDEIAPPNEAILAELKLVRSIDIRRVVTVPVLAEGSDAKLREPPDLAKAHLRELKRSPFKFWPVYRDPWVANRDSYVFHHNPLWFEDPNLERCGRGWGHLTSAVSLVRFNANIAILPYRMTAQPWCSCVRTLPDCTVCEKFGHDAYLPPWSWRAAAVQAGAVVGGIYVIP